MPEEKSQKIQESLKKDLANQNLISEEVPEDTGIRKGEAAADSKVPALHTLKSDISSYMKERDLSLIDMAAQMTKRRGDEEKAIFKTGRNLFAIIGLTIILAAGLAFGVYYLFLRKEAPAGITGTVSTEPLILSEKKETIQLKSDKKEDIIGSIGKINEALIPLNTILTASFSLEAAKESVSSRRFFEILKIIPPPNLAQSLDDNFTLGVYYFKRNNPFLVLKIRSSDLALSGALSWEKNMANDLKEIFAISVPEGQKFQDQIVNNRDSRILYDSANNPVLIYAFFNRKYLIIAKDMDTFNEIFRRLSISPNR